MLSCMHMLSSAFPATATIVLCVVSLYFYPTVFGFRRGPKHMWVRGLVVYHEWLPGVEVGHKV